MVDDMMALLRDRMLRWEGGMERDDRSPAEALVRAYHGMDASERSAFAQACAAGLLAPEPEVRAGAIRVFAEVPEAPDHGALAAALQREDLFTGVPDPFTEGEDLRAGLLRTLAARCRQGDRQTLDLIKGEALQPGRALYVVAALMNLDLPWVERNAAEIVRRTPLVLNAVLWNLQRRGRPVLPLLQALVDHLPGAQLAAAIQAELPSPTREQALGLLKTIA